MITYHFDSAQHRSMLSKLLGQRTRINPIHCRNVVITQPLGETLLSRPMRMFPRVAADNKTSNMNSRGLEVLGEPMFIFDGLIRNTIVSNQGISQDEDLTSVGWVRQGLGVPYHPRVEDDFTGYIDGCTEGAPLNSRRIICEVEDSRVTL